MKFFITSTGRIMLNLNNQHRYLLDTGQRSSSPTNFRLTFNFQISLKRVRVMVRGLTYVAVIAIHHVLTIKLITVGRVDLCLMSYYQVLSYTFKCSIQPNKSERTTMKYKQNMDTVFFFVFFFVLDSVGFCFINAIY